LKEWIMSKAATNNSNRWVVAGSLALALSVPALSFANHPQVVEGATTVDGDMNFGVAEDMDGNDGIFGTISGCLGAMNGGIGQNGTCLISTSGDFAETINITGQVTIAAAPGVEANIEAFLIPSSPRIQAFPAAMMDPFGLQRQPGIIINAPANRQVILRNLTITNWTDGVRIMGDSRVLMDNVRIDHNITNGMLVTGNAQVAVNDSQITSTGFRLNGMTGDFPGMMAPMPGAGINVQGNAQVMIRNTAISGNFGAAVLQADGARALNVANGNNLLFSNDRGRDLPAAMPAPVMAPAAPPAPAPMAPPMM
jgi:hypothetical protein